VASPTRRGAAASRTHTRDSAGPLHARSAACESQQQVDGAAAAAAGPRLRPPESESADSPQGLRVRLRPHDHDNHRVTVSDGAVGRPDPGSLSQVHWRPGTRKCPSQGHLPPRLPPPLQGLLRPPCHESRCTAAATTMISDNDRDPGAPSPAGHHDSDSSSQSPRSLSPRSRDPARGRPAGAGTVTVQVEPIAQSLDAAGGTRAAGAAPGRVVSWTRTCRE
jgi:hypothetical protein